MTKRDSMHVEGDTTKNEIKLQTAGKLSTMKVMYSFLTANFLLT